MGEDPTDHVETDQWDFEETIGDICNGNTFEGIVEPYRFEPCVSDSEEDDGSFVED